MALATSHSKATTALFVALFALTSVADSLKGNQMDFDTQLKLINKPAIKSFQTEYGDIIDCVDMYKQLAFDHPLLRNHTIQMKPETSLKESDNEASTTYKALNYVPKNIKCPPKSVPIRRATREDLIMAESIKSLGLTNPLNARPQQGNAVDIRGHESAVLAFRHKIYGARARLNIWSPTVGDNQFSLGGMWLVNGPRETINSIQAGWIVHSYMIPANVTRLYTFWTANGYQTGCFNTLCPGFVQVSTQFPLGLVLPSSTFSGLQTDMLLSLYQDRATDNWWLMFEDQYIGYWPKQVLPEMNDGARFASWGGEVYSPVDKLSPTMGSGHFAEEGYSKAAYAIQMKVISEDTYSPKFDDPADYALKLWVNAKSCYNANNGHTEAGGWGFYVFFGGPGNCTFPQNGMLD